MIGLSIFLSCLFTWLLYETDWLRVRLPTTAYLESLAQSRLTNNDICAIAWRIKWDYQAVLYGYNKYETAMTPLCGWQWIAQHEHDLDDYQPVVSISFDGYSSTMKIQDLSIIKGLVKTITKTYKPYKPRRRKYIDLARVPA